MISINVQKMTHSSAVSFFIKSILPFLQEKSINIEFYEDKALPCACVPIAGIIDTVRKSGKEVNVHFKYDSYLGNIHFNAPYQVNEHLDSLAFPFSKIWKFDSFDEVTKLVDAYLDELSAVVHCSKGLIEGLEWSLNETMDNVLQHSNGGTGYMMGVVHKSTNYVLFSIFDNGQGILNSLRDSVYHPRTPIDAISLAIQEGKTRDKNIGQGNGLWGLHNIILSNQGRMEITSHGSSLVLYNDGSSKKFIDLPLFDSKRATTIVNFSLNYNNPISVSEALGGYTPIDIRYEDKLDDDNCLHFVLSNESSGFGTRVAGERLRNKIMNYLNRIDSPQRINIDFSGISMISSSFADELIGKLIVTLGFFRFTKIICLTGVSPTIEPIINRSVSQRMAILYQE